MEIEKETNLDELTSLQMQDVEQISIFYADLDFAVERLSKAVTYKTISNQNGEDLGFRRFQ